jgi:hypothetical protein
MAAQIEVIYLFFCCFQNLALCSRKTFLIFRDNFNVISLRPSPALQSWQTLQQFNLNQTVECIEQEKL